METAANSNNDDFSTSTDSEDITPPFNSREKMSPTLETAESLPGMNTMDNSDKVSASDMTDWLVGVSTSRESSPHNSDTQSSSSLASNDADKPDVKWWPLDYSQQTLLRQALATVPAVAMGWVYYALTYKKMMDKFGGQGAIAILCGIFSGVVNAGLYEIIAYKALGGTFDKPSQDQSQLSVEVGEGDEFYARMIMMQNSVCFFVALIPSLPVYAAVYNIRDEVGGEYQYLGLALVWLAYFMRAVATAQSLPQLRGIIMGLWSVLAQLPGFLSNRYSELSEFFLHSVGDEQQGPSDLEQALLVVETDMSDEAVKTTARYSLPLFLIGCGAFLYSFAEHSSISEALSDVLSDYATCPISIKVMVEVVGVSILLAFNVEWSCRGGESIISEYRNGVTWGIFTVCLLTGAPAVSLTDSATNDPHSTQLGFETNPETGLWPILLASYVTGVLMNVGSLCTNVLNPKLSGGVAATLQRVGSAISVTRNSPVSFSFLFPSQSDLRPPAPPSMSSAGTSSIA